MPDEIRPQDAWMQERFARWYAKNPPPLPDRFGRREFAFLFFGQKFMLRHLGARTQTEFLDFLARRGPAHAYYSTAFYQTPDAPTMPEKGWLGAELIFDLDADHVPGAEKLPYKQQLARVKEHFLRLVEDFVIRDFGFDEKDLVLTFSGGRGYHCHVLHEKALGLSSAERREIVDYVTGTGIMLEKHLWTKTVDMKGRGQYARPNRSVRLSPEDAPGWGGRLNREFRSYMTNLRELPKEALVEQLASLDAVRSKNLGEKRTHNLLVEFDRMVAKDADVAKGFADKGELIRLALPGILRNFVMPLAKGETDEPVTADTKRLIRLPGSLHGKSGLKVVTLRLDEVRDFDPLVDAVAFSAEPVRIKLEKPAKTEVLGTAYDLAPGEATVPEAAAVMLVARGAAAPVAP